MAERQNMVRASFTLPQPLHDRLNQLASKSGVSASWLIRYAVQELLDRSETEQLPLPIKRAFDSDV